jgi:hypothetical protein
MTRALSPAVILAERLGRPQRIGVFGHRGVGKTTLLTMLYREAVGGRLAGLRLAAADARTADYLSDKVVQLESGQALPATLGETELRFNLYCQGSRFDLVVMDYQGEHVALGREEPIKDFLRQCDAVWLCLDAPVTQATGPCLQAQQEVEQLVEDYLRAEDAAVPHRPMALALTKADLLGLVRPTGDGADVDQGAVAGVVDRHFGMTRHALQTHCAWHGLFAVSSLGGPLVPEDKAFRPQPAGLGAPLTWLGEALRAQDEARLEKLWELAPRNLALLEKATAAFARRHPDAPATVGFRRRLSKLRGQRWRRRLLGAAACVAVLFLGVFAYDAHGYYQAQRFAAVNGDDPAAVRSRWESYAAWHPTRNVLRPASAKAEQDRLAALTEELAERQRQRRSQEKADRLRELRRINDDPDGDPEAVWARLQQFRADYPEHDVDGDWRDFRARAAKRLDAKVAARKRTEQEAREKKAGQAFAELELAGQRADLPALVDQANRWLSAHAGTAKQDEVERRRAGYLSRIDARAFEVARDYSARYPLNFYTRRQRYQEYLDRHPQGAFVSKAHSALARVEADWDRNDFRAVRDHFVKKPGDLKELQVLCRSYRATHPAGKFRKQATELLRWSEKVSQTGEYTVKLKSGSFDRKVAHMLSRGASLSVTLEVGGVRYGPSNIVKRNYEPQWDYEFPRKVRWKMGDSVKIMVTDHYWWRRSILTINSNDGDPLAMRLLAGEATSGPHRLNFESDFRVPSLPRIE